LEPSQPGEGGFDAMTNPGKAVGKKGGWGLRLRLGKTYVGARGVCKGKEAFRRAGKKFVEDHSKMVKSLRKT